MHNPEPDPRPERRARTVSDERFAAEVEARTLESIRTWMRGVREELSEGKETLSRQQRSFRTLVTCVSAAAVLLSLGAMWVSIRSGREAVKQSLAAEQSSSRVQSLLTALSNNHQVLAGQITDLGIEASNVSVRIASLNDAARTAQAAATHANALAGQFATNLYRLETLSTNALGQALLALGRSETAESNAVAVLADVERGSRLAGKLSAEMTDAVAELKALRASLKALGDTAAGVSNRVRQVSEQWHVLEAASAGTARARESKALQPPPASGPLTSEPINKATNTNQRTPP